MKVIDDQGHELDASFTVEISSSGVDLVVASRSGAGKSAPRGRNVDYEKGVETLLARLGALGLSLRGVSLDSAVARRMPPDERRLTTSSFAFPLDLRSVIDIRRLRLEIRRATVEFGRPQGGIGGNPTKRLRLHLAWPSSLGREAVDLEAELARPGRVTLAAVGEKRGAIAEPVERRAPVDPTLEAPTDDPDLLAARVAAALAKLARTSSLRKSLDPPPGTSGGVRVRASISRFRRDPNVIAWLLNEAAGVCEFCAQPGPFLTLSGEPFLEVHHVRKLADGGPDTTDNAVACCPNCHRRLHFAADREDLRRALIAKVTRLEDHPRKFVQDTEPGD